MTDQALPTSPEIDRVRGQETYSKSWMEGYTNGLIDQHAATLAEWACRTPEEIQNIVGNLIEEAIDYGQEHGTQTDVDAARDHLLAAITAHGDQRAREALRGFAARRPDFHATYNGGWHGDESGMRAFHHGMDTVFNTLDRESALAEGGEA